MFDALLLIGDLVFMLTASLALVAFWLLFFLSNTKPTLHAEFRQRVSKILLRRSAMVRLGTVWDHAEVKVNMEVEIGVPRHQSEKVGAMLGMPVVPLMTPAQRVEVERLNRMYEKES